MTQFFMVMAGGALGAASRYGLSLVIPKNFWAVSTVNIVGSFLAVFFLYSLLEGNKNAQLIAITGFLGAFTTFSAFSLESLQLFQDKQYSVLVTYFAFNIIGSLGAAFAAWKCVGH